MRYKMVVLVLGYALILTASSRTPQPVSNILMLPIPDDASTLLCSTEIKRRELTYYVVAVGLVTLPGNGSSNAAASLDHMYVFALGEFGSPQSSVAIGILHFRDHWTGIIAPCHSLSSTTTILFPLLFFHFCIGDSSHSKARSSLSLLKSTIC